MYLWILIAFAFVAPIQSKYIRNSGLENVMKFRNGGSKSFASPQNTPTAPNSANTTMPVLSPPTTTVPGTISSTVTTPWPSSTTPGMPGSSSMSPTIQGTSPVTTAMPGSSSMSPTMQGSSPVTTPMPGSSSASPTMPMSTPVPNVNDIVVFPKNKRSADYTRAKRQANCGCFTSAQCGSATSGAGLIDFRVVFVPNNTQQCTTGLIFCCPTSQPQQSCGARLQTSAIYPTQPGQAKYGDYPWMVILMGSSDNVYVGGAVLIDLQHVVTTAHRITNYPNGSGLKVRLGEWDVSANFEQYPYKDFTISKVFIHESYNPATLQNDIALVRMTGGIAPGTPAVIPICMPAANQTFDGQRCWVSGWGKDAFGVAGQYQTIVRAADVPILSSSTCENSLRTTRLGTAFILDRASFICAGGEPNKDACTGDGGSGLVCETSPGKWTLVGLVAWGLGCASQGVPAAYVNIVNYLPWITSKQASP